jgi:CDP-2,3-bis-(O-geranylgeranyl)-sn-glycerol synthase
MLELILSSLYFILPAYFANMAPVFAKKLNLPLGKPINEKFFGTNKTWRGFYSAYILALLVLALQYYIAHNSPSSSAITSYSLLDYNQINIFLYAFLFGIGALSGDLFKSFVKRRHKIHPGEPWAPFDQLDFLIFALIFIAPFYLIPWQNFLVLLIATLILHLLANVLAYFLGLKKVWW